jgi:hypothetical protein
MATTAQRISRQDLLNTGRFLQHLSRKIPSQSKAASDQPSDLVAALAQLSSTLRNSPSLCSLNSSCSSKFCPHCQRSVVSVVAENRSVQTSDTLVSHSAPSPRQWTSNASEDAVKQTPVQLSVAIERSFYPPSPVRSSIDRPSPVRSSAARRRPGFVNHLTDLLQRKSESLHKLLSTEQKKETKRMRPTDDLWADYVRHLAMQPGALGPRPATVWREFEEELSLTPSLSPAELKACEQRFGISYSPSLLRTYLSSIKYTERWMRELRRRRLQESHLICTPPNPVHAGGDSTAKRVTKDTKSPRKSSRTKPVVRMNKAQLKRAEAIRARCQFVCNSL